MLQKLMLFLCLVSLVVSTITVTEAAQYQIRVIDGIDSRASSWAYGINNSRQIVGISNRSLGQGCEESYAARWMNGTANVVDLPGGSSTSAQDISENGTIAGTFYSTGGAHAYLWKDGILTDIGAGTNALGISSNGAFVAGYTYGTNGFIQPIAYINNTVVSLGTLGGNGDSFAFDINNSGEAVGYSYLQNGYRQAFLWKDNTISSLGTLGGHESYAYCISNDDKIVGYAKTLGGSYQAFVWQNGEMRSLCNLTSKAYAISPNGRYIVGVVVTPTNPRHQAALWVDGQLTILGSLPEASSDYSIAYSVNDHGIAVGYAVSAFGISRAVVWQPVPEPSSIFTLLCGIGGIGSMIVRRRSE